MLFPCFSGLHPQNGLEYKITLEIIDVNLDDSGPYAVSVFADGTSAVGIIQLIVIEPPETETSYTLNNKTRRVPSLEKNPLFVPPNTELTIACEVLKGTPLPSIAWSWQTCDYETQNRCRLHPNQWRVFDNT